MRVVLQRAATCCNVQQTPHMRSILVWYFGCVGWSRSTLFCHCRRHARWTHSLLPRHIHGDIRSPSLAKQKRHTDSCALPASSSPPPPAPAPPASLFASTPSSPNRSLHIAFRSLYLHDSNEGQCVSYVVKCQVSGVRSQVSGVRSQVSGLSGRHGQTCRFSV